MEKITIYSDGGSRGNPGDAAVGFVVYKGKEKIHEHGEYIGIETNNTAEYKGVLYALIWISENEEKLAKESKDVPLQIECIMDSNLVVNQLARKFKINKSHLRELAELVWDQVSKINASVSYKHVRREHNKVADELLNKALDRKQNKQ